ncbi:histidine kinase [Streptosporangium sp. NPDC049078]|uniref:sensor histidine kinase n=1 Tax=Streptosporangium sp. NPDC049078 TaxID=3155767 RepID=UPI003447246E
MNTLQRPVWRSHAGLVSGVVFVVLLAVLLATGADGPLADVVPSLIAAIAIGVAVWAVRRTRATRADYEARLTSWAATEAVLAERMRIARDLHDIVSHGLGLITVRAAAVRQVTNADGRDVAELREALADIEAAGRNATAELRRMLTVLRTSGDSRDEEVPRLPVESLEQLPAIVRGTEITGLRTRLDLEPLGEVSQGVQVAVCKIVREALNNSARHAGPTTVSVHVYRDGGTVVVTVADSGPDGGPEGPWSARPGAGHGLAGLRERVSGLGGSLHAAAVEGGFRVVARIPDEVGT